jgi:hypothetical protein
MVSAQEWLPREAEKFSREDVQKAERFLPENERSHSDGFSEKQ